MVNIDKQIADAIAKASELTITKLGLRFDKVVVRLLGNIRTSIEQVAPNGKTILFTITAPIRLPAKTEYKLVEEIGYLSGSMTRHRDRVLTISQNNVRLRIVKTSSKKALKFIGLVHNSTTDSKLLLDLATRWLTQT